MKKEHTPTLIIFLNIIYEISDRDYQERIWIRGGPSLCFNPDMFICDFFQSYRSIAENPLIFEIKETQLQTLKTFAENFDSFINGPVYVDCFPEEFVDTPEWKKIMDEAKSILIAFNHLEKKPLPEF
ncbi:MAG: hypothetical protein ACOYL1_06285 [Chlamydiia bacterium]